MLHVRFNQAMDMWSLGLAAAEPATGYPLYPGHMDYNMLSLIIGTQGQPTEQGQQQWGFKTPEEFAFETGFYGNKTHQAQMST